MSSVSNATISAVWKIEAPQLLGALIRLTRDVNLAEDLAQEALVAAIERWPATGVPENPGAWLMTTAKHRAIDAARHARLTEIKQAQISHLTQELSAAPDEPQKDDVLRLILVACHPVVPKEGRVALTLKLVGGLRTEEIARAFLTSEATIAQRIVRAKRTLTETRVPFEVPEGEELLARLPSALEVIYLVFNEGYTAAQGEDWMRPALCQDAMRLGRVLAALVPRESEVHGLVALMELQASRMRARIDTAGNPILLLDQNRARWDHALIQHGLGALARTERLKQSPGVYTLQASIAACHARAQTADATDWPRIVALYDALVELTHSPVIELNRAVAVGMAYGPGTALELVNQLNADGALRGYALLHAARGDLLQKLERPSEARVEFEKAAVLSSNVRERALMLARARGLEVGNTERLLS